MTKYPEETLNSDSYYGDIDNGTMPDNVQELRDAVVGHRIHKVEKNVEVPAKYGGYKVLGTVITLDNGTRVALVDSNDCCAYTELESFLLNADLIDHVITGVGTTGKYTRWHIYADAGDVLELSVGWSSGNPFYYGYGFYISVLEEERWDDAT